VFIDTVSQGCVHAAPPFGGESLSAVRSRGLTLRELAAGISWLRFVGRLRHVGSTVGGMRPNFGGTAPALKAAPAGSGCPCIVGTRRLDRKGRLLCAL